MNLYKSKSCGRQAAFRCDNDAMSCSYVAVARNLAGALAALVGRSRSVVPFAWLRFVRTGERHAARSTHRITRERGLETVQPRAQEKRCHRTPSRAITLARRTGAQGSERDPHLTPSPRPRLSGIRLAHFSADFPVCRSWVRASPSAVFRVRFGGRFSALSVSVAAKAGRMGDRDQGAGRAAGGGDAGGG